MSWLWKVLKTPNTTLTHPISQTLLIIQLKITIEHILVDITNRCFPAVTTCIYNLKWVTWNNYVKLQDCYIGNWVTSRLNNVLKGTNCTSHPLTSNPRNKLNMFEDIHMINCVALLHANDAENTYSICHNALKYRRRFNYIK